MTVTEILDRTVGNIPVEIVQSKGTGVALVFVGGEYAGSAERDSTLGTWGAFALLRPDAGTVKHSEGMWGAIKDVISQHVESVLKAVLAK